jgi:lactoylglutathione lyase
MNVTQAVPFFWVRDMEASLRFYGAGLGFTRKLEWVDDGKLRWCWLELGGAAVMLQEYLPGRVPEGTRGEGLQICFICQDALALYREFRERGLAPARPFVGNRMWVTELADPDGYSLFFESPADAEEESVYEDA